MSIKIYTGFRLSINEISKIQNEIDLLRERVFPVAVDNFVSNIINKLIIESDKEAIIKSKLFNIDLPFDGNILNLNHPNNDIDIPLLKSDYKKHDLFRYMRKSNYFIEQHSQIYRVIFEDPTLTIALFPLDNKVLGIYYSDMSNYVPLIKEMETFEEYHYQDSTDKPKSVSNENWNQRKEDWDKVLLSKDFALTTDVALTANIINLNMLMKEFFQYMTSDDKSNIEKLSGINLKKQRVKYLSLEILFQEEIDKIELERSSEFFRLYIDIKKNIKSTENNNLKTRFKEIEKTLTSILLDNKAVFNNLIH
tara:strand:+ start:1442 stop:2365 length:924 start_codon:yes stop_codon:yes gene_type:complete